jgi:hypothetical protein
MKKENEDRLNHFFAEEERKTREAEKKKKDEQDRADALEKKIALKKIEVVEKAFLSIKAYLDTVNMPIQMAAPGGIENSITWNLWAADGHGLDQGFFRIIFDHDKIRVEGDSESGKPFRAGPWPIDDVTAENLETVFVNFYTS